MANLDDYGALDFAGTDEWGGDSLLPAGDYAVAVSGAEICNSRSSGDPYVKITLTVTEGPCRKRKLFENFSVWNRKTDIPRQRYKSFRRACGLNPNVGGTTEELLGRELVVGVKVRERTDANGARIDEKENRISGYRPKDGASAPVAAPAQAAPASSSSAFAEDDGAPW